MRTMEFKMERMGLLSVGDVLEVSEYELSKAYYYVLGRSFAMSENIDKIDRLNTDKGKVIDIKETNRGFYVTVEFDEVDDGQ